MKRLNLRLSLLAAASFFAAGLTGCASAKIEPESVSPLAVITVAGNSTLPWYVLKDGKEPSANKGLLQNTINSKFRQEDPEILSSYNRLDYAEDALRRILPDVAGIEVLDRETVLSSKSYKQMSSGLFSAMNTTITADGYKDLRSPDKYLMGKLCKETGANGCIVLEFEFFKKAVSGSLINGEGAPHVKMLAKLYNSDGKEIKYKTYTATGAETVKVKAKKYDQDELISYYPAVIDQLITQFAMEFLE